MPALRLGSFDFTAATANELMSILIYTEAAEKVTAGGTWSHAPCICHAHVCQ
jgi:hypothetical protein